jgi:hypothetical protein
MVTNTKTIFYYFNSFIALVGKPVVGLRKPNKNTNLSTQKENVSKIGIYYHSRPLWFYMDGNQWRGLNRFDGTNYTSIKMLNDATSLSNNNIYCLIIS